MLTDMQVLDRVYKHLAGQERPDGSLGAVEFVKATLKVLEEEGFLTTEKLAESDTSDDNDPE